MHNSSHASNTGLLAKTKEKDMLKSRGPSTPKFSAEVMALKKAALDAKAEASKVSILVLQGKASQSEKDAAWLMVAEAAKKAEDAAKAEIAAARAAA